MPDLDSRWADRAVLLAWSSRGVAKHPTKDQQHKGLGGLGWFIEPPLKRYFPIATRLQVGVAGDAFAFFCWKDMNQD